MENVKTVARYTLPDGRRVVEMSVIQPEEATGYQEASKSAQAILSDFTLETSPTDESTDTYSLEIDDVLVSVDREEVREKLEKGEL